MSKPTDTNPETKSSALCGPAGWSTCAIISLVLLRLAIGWHFFCEGKKKISYNAVTGEREINIPSEMLFGRAVGPFADFFKSRLPDFHQWEELLAQPRQIIPQSEEDVAKAVRWQAVYERDRKKANEERKIYEAQFPPTAPYKEWAEQIVEDWREIQAEVVAIKGLSDEQKAAAADALQRRHLQLADFLQTESQDITEWQHELWRLDQWEEKPGAEDIPFREERIAQKRAETTSAGRRWVNEVEGIQRGLFQDWRVLVPAAEDGSEPALVTKINAELEDSKSRNLRRMNLLVTCVILGAGILLLLGLFTRFAAAALIVFLLMVMATQPPWVEGASLQFFYYQLVEVAALGVLIATAAGRFAGLDFFISKCCGGKKK
ncbi:MAG: DoxX family membrane protein [Lacipirellulaceae bacterium]